MTEFLDLSLVTASSLDALLLEPVPPETRQRVLRFPLGVGESVYLSIAQITEILRIETAEILPVPEVPRCVLGIGNWRGEMIWLIDLHEFVGYPSPVQQAPASAALMVMVIQLHQQAVGMVVPQVDDIELHDLQQLQPVVPGLFPPGLLPLILGTLPGSGHAVLDLTALAQSSLWHSQPPSA